MNGRYDRGYENSKANVERDGTPQVLDLNVIYKMLGIANLVRVPWAEYPFNARPGQSHLHFGLPVYDSQIGERVLLTPIVKSGEFRTGNESLPLLSLQGAIQAEITQYHPHLNYDQLNPDWFHLKTIGDIHDIDQLQALLVKRYQPVLGISDAEILQMGVSMRKLKIIHMLTEQEKDQLW